MFADLGITDVWLPPCSQSVAPQAGMQNDGKLKRSSSTCQGYLPSQLFNLDASAYGKKAVPGCSNR